MLAFGNAIVPKKLIACLIIFAVAGCGSQPRQPQPELTPQVQTPVLTEAAARTPADWLAEAEQAATPQARQYALLLAAATFQQQQNWQSSAAVLAQINSADLAPKDWRQFRLLQAQFAAHQQQWAEVLELLDHLTEQFTERSERAQALALRAQAAAAQGSYLKAALWRIEQQRYQSDSVANAAIWQLLQQVPPQQWRDFKRPADSISDGWTRLVQRLHQTLSTNTDIASTLTEWQQSYPDHPAQAIVEEHFAAWLEPRSPIQQVAVLLPLTGPYASQGNAVRDGTILALLKQPQLQATFIDTNTTAVGAIAEELIQLQPDMVVGPLLKEQVQALLDEMPTAQWTHLFLNEQPPLGDAEVATSSAARSAYFFALDPETEVRTAADLLFQQEFSRPLLFAPATGRGEALVDTFTQHWQQLPVANPDVAAGFYRTTEDMKSSVQLNLGVQDSEARITAVKNAAGKIIVEAEPRSRADVDVIYLTGGADQTKLLKPFIDVTISPFAERIPVYASSASHVGQTGISENDLDQVRFSEIPWLLPNHPQRQQLNTVLKLRDGWGYSHARLAAMGHDALLLSPQLQALAQLPGYRHQGLSGALNVVNQRIQRQLEWATFNQHQVVPMQGINYVPSPSWNRR
ncbi:hypothetical protein SAMN06297229_0451 [Pseudidiomarina planktonica]|uniref:LppC lipoprotein n=1 Tax=Pseudidiomarina planktonica TaxID=1323738 RepID=A0A1Y6EE36_9GAMM|nr:penicillin-binding protein activator [Pseudidiomarina planktonica]SMQ60679.1 hypothetical protein SAMN06297229_0451 [Pseudidiomarina planktonica]